MIISTVFIASLFTTFCLGAIESVQPAETIYYVMGGPTFVNPVNAHGKLCSFLAYVFYKKPIYMNAVRFLTLRNSNLVISQITKLPEKQTHLKNRILHICYSDSRLNHFKVVILNGLVQDLNN